VRRRAPTLVDLAAHLAVAAVAAAAALLVAEVWLGLDRLVLPTAALAAGAWAAGWPRRRSRARITRRCYVHLDEALGARRLENDRRATLRHWWKPVLGRELTDVLWPAPQLAGAAALPTTARQRRYVQPQLPPRPWPRPWRAHEVGAVTLRWTSEAHVHAPSFFDQLERKLAQALSLEHTPGMFTRATDWPHDRVTLTRAAHVAVPERLDLREEVSGGRE
jgi:hypothetical protein